MSFGASINGGMPNGNGNANGHGNNTPINISSSIHNFSDMNNKVSQALESNDDADDSDSSFEELETPKVLRHQRTTDSLRNSSVHSQSGRSNRNNDSLYSIRSTTTKVPLKDEIITGRRIATPHRRKPTTTKSSPYAASRSGDITAEDTLIRQQKIISDDNVFSPVNKVGGYLKSSINSPARNKVTSPSRLKVSRISFEEVKNPQPTVSNAVPAQFSPPMQPIAKPASIPRTRSPSIPVPASVPVQPVSQSRPIAPPVPANMKVVSPPAPTSNGTKKNVRIPERDDVVKRLFQTSKPTERDQEEFDTENEEDPEKASTKPVVDSATVRTTSPKYDKVNGLHNIASSVDMASLSTGVDKNSLQVAPSRMDMDMSRHAPPSAMKMNMPLGNGINNDLNNLVRESSDEHEVSLDEPEEILEELNSYSFTRKPNSVQPDTLPRSNVDNFKINSARRTGSPRTAGFQGANKVHSSKSASMLPKGHMSTPITKHFERVENRFSGILNKRTLEESDNESVVPVKKHRPSRLNEHWPNEKWYKLRKLLDEPKLTTWDIITSELVQELLDISESDLEVRVNFLLDLKKRSSKQQSGRKGETLRRARNIL